MRKTFLGLVFAVFAITATLGFTACNTATEKAEKHQQLIQDLASELGVESGTLQGKFDDFFEKGHENVAGLATPPVYNSDLLLQDEDFSLTVFSMGTSLSTWVQEVFKRKMFASDARVFGMTSEGNEVAWKGYAAVAAAKVALESISRSIAVEYAAFGIRSNIIQAGVTPTPALKLIPGSTQMKAVAELRNPFKETTTPEKVADFIALMCTDEAAWVNGSILRVDGGEHIASL